MLPIPPSSVKGPPSWSSVKRRSWLYPNCSEYMTDNFPQSYPIKTNGSDQHEPMLLPNYTYIENYSSTLNNHVCFTKKKSNIQTKLSLINSIQLLQTPIQYSIKSMKNINTMNKLLSLNEIESLKQLNLKFNKNKNQYPIKLNLLKQKHFVLNNQNVLKEKFNNISHQLLVINNNNVNNHLLQLPLNSIKNNYHCNQNNNQLHNDYVTSKNELNALNNQQTTNCKSISVEPTLQILTYSMPSNVKCNLDDQPTLNVISWIIETTKENNKSLIGNNTNNNNKQQGKYQSSFEKNDEKKSYHDIGVQYNFVDYVDFNAFTTYGNVTCFADFVDQQLCSDIGHITEQFLSRHTSDLINWNNKDNDRVICMPLDTRLSDYNEQISCNIKQISSKIEHNQNLCESMPIIQTSAPVIISSGYKSELISDPITANKLQYTNTKNQEDKPLMNNEVRSSILSFNKQESNCIPLNVLKALSEIDNRLNVIDQVSIQLEKDHKRNQELLETIIQLNKDQNQINATFQSNDLKTVQPITQQQDLNISVESNVKSNLVYTKEPTDNKISNSAQIQTHDCIAVKQKNQPPQSNQRLYSISGYYSEEREKIRKERREASLTQSNLPVQSSPILNQPNTVRPSTAPLRRGRSQTRGRGTSRVLTVRNVPKNYTTPFNPKPPTPARSAANGRNAQKPPVVTRTHPDPSKHLIYEDDLQTTILSDWSLESDVKRLLYGDEEDRFRSPSKAQSITEVSNFDQESQIPRSPHSIPETDLLTEIGGVPSTSFIDWDEIDELINEI
ncbi:Chromatin assembly factor 1 subunit B [Schistosoma japonicum]|nr:Chromatin assembly factor 1 subunit B [Schistosoma japonicum]